MKRIPLPFVLPLLAGVFIVVWGGGLGVSFIFLGKTALEEWGAIIVGLGLTVLVPAMAGILSLPKR